MPDVTVGSTAAYLAVPVASPGPWPGVVAIHEAFGLNDGIRAHADRLAALGYLALAPDLLAGRYWMRCVRSLFRQIAAGSGAAFEVLDACRGWLRAAKKRRRCTSMAAGNMARISVPMVNSWAWKYVIAASATGSSSQNETSAGFRAGSPGLPGAG
ncbi:MAG TPA: dienelactone hydrolase family protein [Streptosporangiaceae bacterium]|nr:dienelactone hydrolase family protein [Streptosporangiaceae bacterium]